MWRGFFVSCKYSVSCWSESLRPNQVFHQNRNGIRQISQAVTKKRSFWVRDMPGLGGASVSWAAFGLADIIGKTYHGVTESRRKSVPGTTLRHRRPERAPAPGNARRRTGPGAGFGA